MKALTFTLALVSLSAWAHPPQNISVTIDGQVYQCQGQPHTPGHNQVFAVELFDNNDCNGTPRWSVRAASQCSGSRPDFYATSAKILFGNGNSFCMRFDRQEEDVACRNAFQN